MEPRTMEERKAPASGWLGLAALVGALAGLTLFPRKAHGALKLPQPRAKPADPPG